MSDARAKMAQGLRALAKTIDLDENASASDCATADLLRELAKAVRVAWWDRHGEQVVNVLLARLILATSTARRDDEHVQLVNDACANVDRALADAATVDRRKVFDLRAGIRVKAHPSSGTVDDARRRLRALGEAERRDFIAGNNKDSAIPFRVLACVDVMRPSVRVRDKITKRVTRTRVQHARLWSGFQGLSPSEQTERECAGLRALIEERVGFKIADRFSNPQLAELLRAWGRTKASRGSREEKMTIASDVLSEAFQRKIDAAMVWKRGLKRISRGNKKKS